MTYDDALIYIEDLTNRAYEPSHDNSVHLMTYLGNPQDTMAVIHVAGTNGKGSTIAFMAHIFQAGGYKVGTFTSPHILSPLELTTVNGLPISQEAFAQSMYAVKRACDAMVADGLSHPTAFECLTASALFHLAGADLDVAIIEVGMGGRYDATNVFKKPLLTLITAIGLDHQAFLGDTLEAIAWHKGGIIRPQTPTVLAPNPIDVVTVISDIVREKGHKLYLMDEGFIREQVLMTTGYSKLFHLGSNFFDYKGLRTTMLGRHQTLNLATALLAIHQLRHTLPVTEAHIKAGVQNTTWTCRGDLIRKDPLILVDGAHNMPAIHALHALLERRFKGRKLVTVMGVLDDKERLAMLKAVAAFSDVLIVTRPLSPRASKPTTLENPPEAMVIDAYDKALEKALSYADDRTLILVLGSLYLAYPAKAWLLDRR